MITGYVAGCVHHYFLSFLASIEVNVLGDGTATLVCTAQQVVYMQWSISLTDTDIIVDFDTITRSLTEAITIVEGVTLLSALVTIQRLSTKFNQSLLLVPHLMA